MKRIPQDLCVGDRVVHSTCGPGTVTAIDWNASDWRKRGVYVEYDHIGERGQPWHGLYDRDWFRNASATLTLEDARIVPGEFVPCFTYNRELDLLQWLQEDCGYYASPIASTHAADVLYSIDDGRVVGVQIWGAFAAIQREQADGPPEERGE